MSLIPQANPTRGIHVAIPFYRNPDLVTPLLNSLMDCRDELAELNCTIALINDSPDDPSLAAALEQAVSRFPPELVWTITTNQSNLGYVRSINAACDCAVRSGADVILLNSDTVVFAGAFREMRRVAYADSMIGFVSPRSNNATLCTFPHHGEFVGLPPEKFHDVFRDLSGYLPDFHYVPTCVGFCLYVKHSILAEVGLFDESYGKGYSEENDLIMRANRLGYRAVLANRAFVYHIGEKSFSASDTPKGVLERRNVALLGKRYPEYFPHVDAYFEGTRWEAERLLAGLLPDSEGRIDVAFDCSQAHKRHNGTFRAMARIIREAASTWGDRFNIHVIADEDVAAFHGFIASPRVSLNPVDTTRVFGIAYRFGQPFDTDAFLRMSRLAPVNVYAMLDTIAWDCLHLSRTELDELWQATARLSDGILYISDFARDQFLLRFPVRPGVAEKVSYLSLLPEEYLDGPVKDRATNEQGAAYFLLIGNSFAHKLVEPTVKAVAQRLPRTKMVALGLEGGGGQNLTAYGSGQLGSMELDGLFAGARAVIFPSTYEGFGMPIFEALSHRRVIYARDTPLNRVLHARLGHTRNLILYENTNALVDRLAAGEVPEWIEDVGPTGGQHGWASHVRETKQLLEAALTSFSCEGTLMPRLSFAALLKRAYFVEKERIIPEGGSNLRRPPFRHGGLDLALSSMDVVPLLEDLRSEIEGIRADHSSERVTEIASLRKVIDERDAAIAALHRSLSWTVTAPLRLACEAWLRVFGRKVG